MTVIEWGALDRAERRAHAMAEARSAVVIDADRARSLVGADPEAALPVAQSSGLTREAAEWLARWSLARIRRGGRTPGRIQRLDGTVLTTLMRQGRWEGTHPLVSDIGSLATDPGVIVPLRLLAVEALFTLAERPEAILRALVQCETPGMESAGARAVLDAGATEAIRACYLTGEGSQLRILRLAAMEGVHAQPELRARLARSVAPHAETPLLWNLVRSAPVDCVRELYRALAERDPGEADSLYPKLSDAHRQAIGPEGLAPLLVSDVAAYRERAFVRLGE